MKRFRFGWLLLLITIISSLVIIFWRNFSPPEIEFTVESKHPDIKAVILNQEELKAFLNEINFFNTSEYFAVEERLSISRRDVKRIAIVFTDEPQGKMITYGSGEQEVVSRGYKFVDKTQTLEVLIFIQPGTLNSAADPVFNANYHLLTSLYYLLYLNYDEFITSNQFDFYGTVHNIIVEYLKRSQSVANYEF